MDFDTLSMTVDGHVAHVYFNRPDKANALNETMWQELGAAMEWCDAEPDVRAVVLSGEGRHFCWLCLH
jgi:enoyl-CoA hydratase